MYPEPESQRVVEKVDLTILNQEPPDALESLVEGLAPPDPGADIASFPRDYLGFFGLARNPFADSVDPRFFYRTQAHEEIFVRMVLAVQHQFALGLVTGGSGTGKTLLSQMILKELEAEPVLPLVILVTPGMTKTALLREILAELEQPLPEGPFVRTQDMVKQLHDRVMELHTQGRRLVLLVDEAHFLASDSLHIIRTISNLETPESKLSTCILFGEDRLLKRLEHPSYESLRHRIYFRGELPRFTEADTEQYVKYRMMVAGGQRTVFADATFPTIHELSRGIGRRINKICTLALIEAFIRGLPEVDADVVRTCERLM